MFITFEGPEGAGKSTQIALLSERLKANKHDFLLTREPGGTELGNQIREILLNSSFEITKTSEFLLFAASRAQIVEKIIKPALKNGQIVICDRFIDSSLAYQGYGRGLDTEFIEEINKKVTNGLIPDRTFLFDIDPSIGLERVKIGKLDRIEQNDLEFHQKIRDGFLKIAKQYSDRFVLIDASQNEQAIADIVWANVSKML